ncbi:MAG: hypothetical protein V1818_02340 [Candidatus Aenigmatarchaeota archaeon]
MKVEAEKILLIVLILGLASLCAILVTPLSDNYLHYTVSERILENPNFLRDFDANAQYLAGLYPPLLHILYALLLSVQLPFKLLDIISIIVALVVLYKIEKKAVPLMMLSFLFLRVSVQGGVDIFLLVMSLLAIYYFEKKPIVGGIFAGLTTLTKGTGFLFFGAYIIAILIFKRFDIFRKDFYKSKFFLAILVAFAVMLPWYIGNFIYFHGDIVATVVGYSASDISSVENWLETDFQKNQPERYWFDTSGYYPLPIDLLFYIGIAFTAYGLCKTRKLEKDHIFIFIFVLTYFAMQILSFEFLITIRYYLPIFPLLAIQISRGLPKKYMKFVYIMCLVMFVFFAFSLPKYAWNDMDSQMSQVCSYTKLNIGSDPVYVIYFQKWYIIYRCDLNYTQQAESKWTFDLDQGSLYLTNNTTGV